MIPTEVLIPIVRNSYTPTFARVLKLLEKTTKMMVMKKKIVKLRVAKGAFQDLIPSI